MAGKEVRVPRPKAELEHALAEQVSLLVAYCDEYDRGALEFCKPMATALRVLVHETGRSKSLLGQLHLRSGRFFTVVPPLNGKNLLTGCGLLVVRVSVNGGEYLPQLDFPSGRQSRLPFPEWWVRPVATGKSQKTMSRMDIVLAVADMDGGSHVDGSLTELYRSFRTGEFLGWYIAIEGEHQSPMKSPQYACIRAIAHELLTTLQKYHPRVFLRPYPTP